MAVTVAVATAVARGAAYIILALSPSTRVVDFLR